MTEEEKAYQYFVIAVPESEEQAKAYFWARKALRITLTPPNEWVSVEDAMPPEHEPVLCIVSGKPNPNITLEDAYQLGSWNKADGWIIDEYLDWEDADVSWWMSLPAPPDKDNNVLAKTPNESLTLEQLRASPHGKIKDSTLQSICNRANEIACRPPEGEA